MFLNAVFTAGGISLVSAIILMAISAYYFLRAETSLGCLTVLTCLLWIPCWVIGDVFCPESFRRMDTRVMTCTFYALWSMIPGIIPLFILFHAKKRRYPVMRKGAIYACLSVLFGGFFIAALMYISSHV